MLGHTNGKKCGFKTCCKHNISYFHQLHDTGLVGLDLLQAMCCMVVEPTGYRGVGMVGIAYIYLIVSIKRHIDVPCRFILPIKDKSE